MLGIQVALFAVPTIGIVALSASSFETGSLMALELHIYLLLIPIAGAHTDRARCRPLITASAPARTVLPGLPARRRHVIERLRRDAAHRYVSPAVGVGRANI